jgi:phosphatidylglycerol:prolipoprotein diacylglycerol transferase
MPQGFNIGPLTIRFYALLIILGAIVGAWIASRQAKKHHQDPEIILDLLPWLLIGGIIGARLWHVFTPSASNIAAGVTTENYLRNPIEILKMWKGGLGIPGGVIGGALALWLYTKIKKLNFLQWADFLAPGLLVGQAIGRWGNFINQEVYGKPSDLPWAITIDPPYRIWGFEHVSKYHPLFLYESLLALLGALILWLVDKKCHKKLFKGDLLWLYLVIYPVIRFFLEFLRLDPSPVKNINVNQTAMMVVGILAALVLIIRHTALKNKLVAREAEDAQRELEAAEAAATAESEEETASDEELSDALTESEAEMPEAPLPEEEALETAEEMVENAEAEAAEDAAEDAGQLAEDAAEDAEQMAEDAAEDAWQLAEDANPWLDENLPEEPQD